MDPSLHQLDHACLPMIARMEEHGLLVDTVRCKAFGAFCSAEMANRHGAIEAMIGMAVNPNSSDQVASLLFDRLGLPPSRLTYSKKRYAADDKTLEGLRDAHAVIEPILEYRELSKLKSTYCDAILRGVGSDGRLHPNIRATRVPTGRLSAHDPNLLAMPTRSEWGKEIRKCFIAPPGRELFTIDLDQIEMRVTASEAEDAGMIAAFVVGDDIHRISGADCFSIPLAQVTPQQRQVGKTVGFGMLNDMSGAGLLDQFRLYQCFKAPAQGDEKAIRYTREEADAFVQRWHDARPGVSAWKEQSRSEARRYGYVEDMWGRVRYFPEVASAIPRIVAEGLRAAVNHKIQGGAQGIIKRGMALIWYDVLPAIQEICYCEPLLQVHDELVWEVEKGAGEMIGVLMGAALAEARRLRVEIKSKYAVGPSWGELEK
jgi:DNA polymerase I